MTFLTDLSLPVRDSRVHGEGPRRLMIASTCTIRNIRELSGHEEAGARVAGELANGGAGARFVRADVAAASDVDALVEAATGRFGSLEILMHFAGIGMERHALRTTREDWDRILAVNLTGTFLVMQAAVASSTPFPGRAPRTPPRRGSRPMRMGARSARGPRSRRPRKRATHPRNLHVLDD